MTTPDSITTARKLLAAEYRSHGAIIYAEELEAGREEGPEDLVHTTHSLRAISKLAMEVEKLKAENERLRSKVLDADAVHEQLREAESTRDRLKAERDEFAATIVSLAEHRNALTSQLEQAERVMEYAGDVRWLELAQGSPFTTIDRQMLHEMHSRASQWIKDRQAKTDVAIGDK